MPAGDFFMFKQYSEGALFPVELEKWQRVKAATIAAAGVYSNKNYKKVCEGLLPFDELKPKDAAPNSENLPRMFAALGAGRGRKK